MATKKRRQIVYSSHTLTRRDKRQLAKLIAKDGEVVAKQEAVTPERPPFEIEKRFISRLFTGSEVSLPQHVGTGWEVACAAPFAVSDVPLISGPVLGLELTSGNTPFVLHPWNMYLNQIVSSPNILVMGSLRRGKSFIIKRLVSLMSLYGVYSINTSDVKGEHGVLAEALGGTVFRVGAFGSSVRVNPLSAGERHFGETAAEHQARLLSTRQNVLQMIAALLADESDIPVTPMQRAMLSWALDEVIRETNDHPTVRLVLEKLTQPGLETVRGGMFERSAAQQLLVLFDPLISGNLAGMFEDEGTITFDPTSPYTVFDTFAMEKRGDLALAITQTITNAWVQNTVSNKASGRRYMVIREEGWRDMKTLQALEAHELQLKLSGEFGITMVMIVHEAGDFDTGGEQERNLARKLLRGYANTITFYQGDSTLRQAVAAGTLTQGEANVVSGLGRGEFLFKTGTRSWLIDGNPTTTEWERRVFDTDKAMRLREAQHQG